MSPSPPISDVVATPGAPRGMSRRQAVGLLLGSAVLPAVIGAAPASASARPVRRRVSTVADALRRLEMRDLRYRRLFQIANDRYRMTFSLARWRGGETIVRDLELRRDGAWVAATDQQSRLEEQWVVYRHGGPGHPRAEPVWLAFDEVRSSGGNSVEMRAGDPALFDLVVQWTLDGDHPEAQFVLTAHTAGDFIVGYQSGEISDLDGVDEVLCGAQQHAKAVLDDPQPRGAWELFAPMALTQREVDGGPLTTGVFVPAEVLEFEHEQALGGDDQPFGMSLRNDSLDITPTIYAPQPGLRATMAAGESRGFTFGVCAFSVPLYDAFAALARDAYDLRAYRSNVYGSSLTDTVHTMLDLAVVEPATGDSEDFVPSFSGWWSRAKGFMNVEITDDVRVAVGGVLQSAHLLTATTDDAPLYAGRARPMVEYQLSRGSIAYSPLSKPGQVANQHRLGYVAGDAIMLNALYELSGHRAGGIRRLGIASIAADEVGRDRPRFAVELAAYQLTGDGSHLTAALRLARDYIEHEIDTAYTTVPAEGGFAISYSRSWLDLVVLYEATGEADILAGAYREAQRFVTQTTVRPVPVGGTVTVGQPPVRTQQYDWPSDGLPAYPRTAVDVETVPSWYVSTTGLTFEQLTTYKVSTSASTAAGGGFVFNPCWAGALLRLGHYADDDLIVDLAHNMVIGRYTNYPGYYSRDFQVIQMKPDFPLQGPSGVTAIYPHHMPAQIGMTIDYLVSEHLVRSDGQIDFPGVHEADYVYFRYTLFGHAPGRFYGEDGVWPWFPRGIVEVDNPAVNWLTGVGNGSLYLSLTNTSGEPQVVVVSLATDLLGLLPNDTVDVEVLSDPSGSTASLPAGGIEVTVPPHGIVAIAARAIDVHAPWHVPAVDGDHGATTFHARPADANLGTVRGVLLPRAGGGSGYDAYVMVDSLDPVTLEHRVDEGAWVASPEKPYPYEWTIGVDEVSASFTYRVVADTVTTDPVTLRLPAAQTGGSTIGVLVDLDAPSTTVAGADLSVRVIVRNRTSAALAGAAVDLGLPSGWTVTPDSVPTEPIPAAGTASWIYDVSVAPDATAGAATLAATAAWTGGSAQSEPFQLTVRDPRRLVGVIAGTQRVTEPGQQFTVTATVSNPGTQAVDIPVTISGPGGWVIDVPTAQVSVPAGDIERHTVTVTAPAELPWGTSPRFTASLDGIWSANVAVAVATEPQVVHVQSPWPLYQETGQWRFSGLAGWGGTRSRYNLDSLTGGTARWAPDIPAAGSYEVSVWYPAHTVSATQAAFVVRHGGGEDTVVVDQTSGGGEWRSLGYYEFEAGRTGDVYLEVQDAETHRTSAVRFRPTTDADLRANLVVSAADIATPGGNSTLTVSVSAAPAAAIAGCLSIGVPAGWLAEPGAVDVDVAAGDEQTIEVEIQASAIAAVGALHEVTLTLGELTTTAIIAVGEVDPGNRVVIDTGSGAGSYGETGAWAQSNLRGWDGGVTRWIAPATAGTAAWTPALGASGRYRVSVWFPGEINNSTRAVYQVTHAGGQAEVELDQREGSAWIELGIWDLDVATATIALTGLDTGRLRADAVRTERLETAENGMECDT
ncbi:NEW3 domain-containing protein [Occultella aeris]|uniref:Xanthan lyase n=1 Tax=Occultella aeris TaxID=2761496 RepID=A0A7M4DDR3_9MICO|nr:NEW3 domain-containing protein [Occultella aeris]VZO34983.1 Xanthan lyase precursor [Occultella aeris]